MYVNFHKSLDRAVDVFNLRGAWIVVFLAVVGALFFIAFIVGFIAGGAAGFCFFLVGLATDYLICLLVQQTISHRDLRKLLAKDCRLAVDKRETLVTILISQERSNPSDIIKKS